MVHHHRIPLHQPRTGEVEQQPAKESMGRMLCTHYLSARPSNATLLRLFFLFSLVYCSLVLAPRLLSRAVHELGPDSFPSPSPSSTPSLCSSFPNNTICCDRSAFRTDICFLSGDVRTNPGTSSVLLANSTAPEQRIRPYTRKWESAVMATIDELRLSASPAAHPCDVRHHVPAVIFSTGGYTGNVYHEFNDGLLPLYITSQQYNRKVVFVLLEYHDWWITKYADVLSRLSDYPPLDFNDPRTHCFPRATVGLRIHDELTIDPARMPSNATILDFRRLLDDAYRPRIRAIEWGISSNTSTARSQGISSNTSTARSQKPKLVVVSRNGSRAIENERELVGLAEEVGFRVEVLRPDSKTEMAKVYRALNSCDAMVGVHGAAMTHFLFMRPGSVFIQVVPLGTDWAAEAYYGEPAARMGLRYVRYRVRARESSLWREYPRDHPVLRDPDGVNAKGWETTKKVYLDGQKVHLDLHRFRKRLVGAHRYLVSKKTR